MPANSQLVSDESWRYDAIREHPHITRLKKWFSSDEYVICNVWGIWMPARIIEVCVGKNPALMVCKSEAIHRCPSDYCDSDCDHRLWTMNYFGGILNEMDLMRIINMNTPLEIRRLVMDTIQAKKLLQEVYDLKKMQMGAKK